MVHHEVKLNQINPYVLDQPTSQLLVPNFDTSTLNSGVSSEEISLSNDIESTSTGYYTTLVVSAAAIGGFMFGYDTACISSILLFLDQPSSTITLDSKQKEIITGITSIGSLIGCLITALISDRVGRKPIITACCVIFSVMAVQLSLSTNSLSLVFGRLILGLAVGSASMIVPVYISEVSSSKNRGKSIVMNSVSTTGGQLMANLIAFIIKDFKYNWRLMFLLSSIPPVLFLLIVGFITESPRHLLAQNKDKLAVYAIAKLYPNATDVQIQTKIEEIRHDIDDNNKILNSSLWERLFASHSTVLALSVGCGLMFFQQATGFNSFMYYGATIFANIGVGDPLIVSILISGTNFLFTFVAFRYIDRFGRRRILLSTVWIMPLSLFIASLGFWNIDNSSNKYQPILLVVAILTFVASYASAMGAVPWSSVEFLPLEARAPGSAIIASTGWLTNFLVSATYLSLMNQVSGTGTCIIFGVVCILGWFGIYRYYPEVNGLSLEEIRNVFADGIHIHYRKTVV